MVPLDRFIRNSAISHYIALSKEEKLHLALLARAGDSQAREKIIFGILLYCEKLAYRYAQMYQHMSHRIEYADLFQMAILHALETLDQALATHADPFPYLVVSIRRELIEYCLYRAHLIRMPETRTKDGKPAHEPYSMESISEDDCLAEPRAEPYDAYPSLYVALGKLRGRALETIKRHFGIDGPAESLPVISRALTGGASSTMAGSYQRYALKILRREMRA